MTIFKSGPIEGVVAKELKKHSDSRGWLIELFRSDEMLKEFLPAMSYVSATDPGIVRGPHEHKDQADVFCFVGPSTFKVFMWDNRKGSTTFQNKFSIESGERRPMLLIVPPGVVHAYRNIGPIPGFVINMPNRLYAGRDRGEAVDEIRHESDPNTVFILE